MFILNILQIIISALLIITILLQQRGSGTSSLFGGGQSANFYKARGLGKFLLVGTIILAALFLGLAVLNIIF